MRIGIIGAARVGLTLATRYAACGHDVLLANSSGPASVAALLSEPRGAIRPSWVEEAVDTDVVFMAAPWMRVSTILRTDLHWSGQVLVDTTNIFTSYAPDYAVDDLGSDSGSQLIARLAPGARVVKAFNTLPFDVMFAPTPAGFSRVLFVAGDDDAAVSLVSDLIRQIGLHPLTAGDLAAGGRRMELGGAYSLLELLTPVDATNS